MKRIRIALLALGLVALAARAEDPPPFVTSADTRGLGEYEQRLWGAGDEFDRLILRTGLVDDDAELRAYLQGVLDRLFPKLVGSLRVRVLRSPMLNAFALPNGSIYINQGMLARFENEAQLATVLAHEGSHFTQRHSLRQQERAKSLSLVRLVTSMIGMPFPWVKDLLLASSMFGYSRAMESEADARGFERLRDSGYALAEAPKVFRHLLQELQASEVKEPFFFATHPKLQDRIETMSALVANAPGSGRLERDDFLRRLARVRAENLAADLEMQRPMSVIAALDFGVRTAEYPPTVFYTLGEAYRIRGREGDAAIAEVLLEHALQEAPEHYPTHFSLGTLYFRRGDLAAAAEQFSRFVEAAPQAPERAFAALYLERISARRDGVDP